MSANHACLILLASFLVVALTPTLAAQAPTPSIAGTVSREGLGTVEGAQILLTDASGDSHTAVTNAQGDFQLSDIPAGPATVRLETACCSTQIHDVQIPAEGQTIRLDATIWTQTTMPAKPSQVLWGQTFDARNGQPMPWVRVGASVDSTYYETASREDGTYFLDLPQGSGPISATRVDTIETRFEKSPTGDEHLNIPVYLGPANVKVQLANSGSASATRIADCPASACMPPPPASVDGRFQFSDAGGATHFGVAAGFSYSAAKVMPGRYELTATGDAGVARNTLDILPGQTWELEARLRPESDDRLLISGTVLDETSREPLEGIFVDVRNEPRGQLIDDVRTDDHGRFSTMVSPGAVRISFQPYDNNTRAQYGYTYYPVHYTFALSATQDLPVTLPRTQQWTSGPATLLGWIVDSATNSGVPGATIQIRNEETYDWGEAVAGSDGSFRFVVTPGRYTLAAISGDHTWSLTSVAVNHGTTWHNLTLVDPHCCGEQEQGGWYGRLVEPQYYVPGRPEPAATPSTSQSSAQQTATGAPLALSGTGSPESPIRGSDVAMYAGEPGGLGAYRPAQDGRDVPAPQAPGSGEPVPAAPAYWTALALAVATLVILAIRKP